MIVCRQCESAQFLHIHRSVIRFDCEGELDYFVEEYVCTFCGAEGDVDSRQDPKEGVLDGEVAFTTEHPQYV